MRLSLLFRRPLPPGACLFKLKTMQESQHTIDARRLRNQLNEIIPSFMEIFNETENPELAELLNNITPGLISYRYDLQLYIEITLMKENRLITQAKNEIQEGFKNDVK
jgi:hypothetical protein